MTNQNVGGPQAPYLGPPVPPFGPPLTPKEAKAQAKASKAYAKASRPFYKKKRFIFPVVLIVIIGIIVIVTTSNSKKTQAVAAASCAGKTYPDQQPNDTCADAAGSVALDGFTVTAQPLTATTDALGTAALCSNTTLTNTSDKSQDYNVLDFSVQSPSGNVGTLSTMSVASTLSSGTLIAGAAKTGLVCTNDAGEKGSYIFIYKPNPFSSDRGIWQFTV